MNRDIRLTLPTALVLHGLHAGYRYGFELIEASGITAGTMYPILRRLEDGGYVSGAWERVAVSRAEGRPPRRYYRLTPAGESLLAEAVERYPAVRRAFAPDGGASPERA